MKNAGRIFLGAALVGSLCLHAAVLNVGVRPATAEVSEEKTLEVALIEELPPPPEPPAPEPVLIPDEPPPPVPEPEPLPPEPEPEEVLTAPEPEKALPPPPAPKPRKIERPPEPAKPAPRPAVAKTITAEARPDYSRNPPPRYPEMARRNGWEGRIMVRVRVSPQGRVLSAEVTRASSYGILDQAALRAVKTWHFRPRIAGGQPVEAVVEVPVNFSLRR